jgi:hypothetical protein
MMTYEYPQEWYDRNRVFSAEIENIKPHYAQFKLRMATKGGWKKGYTWGGKFRLDIYANTYGRLGRPHKNYTTYVTESIEDVRKAFDRAEKYGVRTDSKGFYLICLYRDGIADSAFSKRVGKSVRAMFPAANGSMPIYDNPEAQRYIQDRAFALLRRRGYTEDITGIVAPDGNLTFDDLGIWATPPAPSWAA